MNNQNGNEEYYKKKYYKYKAKYLKLQLGGIYVNKKNLINPNIPTEVGSVAHCDLFYKDNFSLRNWIEITLKSFSDKQFIAIPNYIKLLAFDQNSNILISSHQGKYLSIIDKSGNIITKSLNEFSPVKFIDATFYGINLIIIDSNNKINVYEKNKKQEYIFKHSITNIVESNILAKLQRFGKPNTPINFVNLRAVTIRVGDKPEICVTDKNKIHIFDLKEFKFLNTIEYENTNFNSIAIDSKNNIVVSDEFDNSIKIFNPDSKKLIVNFRHELLSKPCGIIFDKDENLLIGSNVVSYITILNYKHNSKGIDLSLKYCVNIISGKKPTSILIDSSGKILYNYKEDINKFYIESSCRIIDKSDVDKLDAHTLWFAEEKPKKII